MCRPITFKGIPIVVLSVLLFEGNVLDQHYYKNKMEKMNERNE